MHLQIRSKVVTGTNPPGTMSIREGAEGVTVIQPGRLLRLLDLLAQDQTDKTQYPDGDGLPSFSLIAAAGSGIETTGEFAFVVYTPSDDEKEEEKQQNAARDRIRREFPATEVVPRDHEDVPHRAGALRDYIAKFADDGLLIDEIVVGVADCTKGTGGEISVPVQVHALRPIDR